MPASTVTTGKYVLFWLGDETKVERGGWSGRGGGLYFILTRSELSVSNF